MSEPREPTSNHHHPPPPIPSDVPAPASDPEPGAAQPEADDEPGTIGTGTSIALGCIASTLLLVVIGLIFLAVVWFLG